MKEKEKKIIVAGQANYGQKVMGMEFVQTNNRIAIRLCGQEIALFGTSDKLLEFAEIRESWLTNDGTRLLPTIVKAYSRIIRGLNISAKIEGKTIVVEGESHNFDGVAFELSKKITLKRGINDRLALIPKALGLVVEVID